MYIFSYKYLKNKLLCKPDYALLVCNRCELCERIIYSGEQQRNGLFYHTVYILYLYIYILKGMFDMLCLSYSTFN